MISGSSTESDGFSFFPVDLLPDLHYLRFMDTNKTGRGILSLLRSAAPACVVADYLSALDTYLVVDASISEDGYSFPLARAYEALQSATGHLERYVPISAIEIAEGFLSGASAA